MPNDLADITVHIDEALDFSRLGKIEEDLLGLDGVVSACHREDKPHLVVVAFNLEKLGAHDILTHVKSQGVHAELIGM
ncbi:MAG: ATP-binding protein [Betaproteobacteria bacterium]